MYCDECKGQAHAEKEELIRQRDTAFAQVDEKDRQLAAADASYERLMKVHNEYADTIDICQRTHEGYDYYKAKVRELRGVLETISVAHESKQHWMGVAKTDDCLPTCDGCRVEAALSSAPSQGGPMNICGSCGYEGPDHLATCHEPWKRRAEVAELQVGDLTISERGWRATAEDAERQVEEYRKALHKIACAECTVHDEHCEVRKHNGALDCACDARVAANALVVHYCPTLERKTGQTEKPVREVHVPSDHRPGCICASGFGLNLSCQVHGVEKRKEGS